MINFKEYNNNKTLNESIDSTKFQPGKSVRASQLKKGNLYFAFYRNNGNKIELFRFTGFSNAEEKYGESGPIFDDIKQIKKEYNIKTMADIEKMDSQEDREYGQNIYMCGEWEDGTEGCFYYVCNKAWSRGSGCDKLSFSEAVPAKDEL